jgi:hypothetical protein
LKLKSNSGLSNEPKTYLRLFSDLVKQKQISQHTFASSDHLSPVHNRKSEQSHHEEQPAKKSIKLLKRNQPQLQLAKKQSEVNKAEL